MGVQQLALLRQADAPGLPQEQAAAQLRLQKLHHPGHIGLTVPQGSRGFGDIPVFGHIVEDFEIFEVDIHI